jgi:hypothetical protein
MGLQNFPGKLHNIIPLMGLQNFPGKLHNIITHNGFTMSLENFITLYPLWKTSYFILYKWVYVSGKT